MSSGMSFDTAKRIAAKKGLPEAWAYRFHNPAQDNFALLKKWRNMKASPAKDELKAKMSMNPTLHRHLTRLANLHNDLDRAVNNGNLKKVQEYLRLGVEPTSNDLSNAIYFDRVDIVNELLKAIEPSRKHTYEALKNGNLDIVKALTRKGPN